MYILVHTHQILGVFALNNNLEYKVIRIKKDGHGNFILLD